MNTVRMYSPGRVIHTVDTATDRTLCKRPTTGLHTLPVDPWTRIGAEAGTNGPCMRCVMVPDNAYAAGWAASSDPDHGDLDAAEARYCRTHKGAIEQDMWLAGWIDYASDYAYGTALREYRSAIR